MLEFDEGKVVFRAPVSYQTIEGHRMEVESEYVIDKDNRVSFKLGDYDKKAPLVIDPVLVFSTLIGGSDDDAGNSISVDNAGNVWITGATIDSTTDYPVTDGSTHKGSKDVFVTKFNAIGARLFSTLLGGTGNDEGKGIAVDSAGNVWFTGLTVDAATDYPVNNGSTHNGAVDVFVTKLNSAGTLLFSGLIGGSSDDVGNGIALDVANNVWITGETFDAATDYPVTDASSHKGGVDAFVTKFSPAGAVILSSLIGGTGNDYGSSVKADIAGNAWITGNTADAATDYPVTNGSTHKGGVDAFVTKFNATGIVQFSTLIGGGSTDFGNGIAADRAGNVWITGNTIDAAPDYPVTNGSTHKGFSDVFVTKFSSAGAILFSTLIGGGSDDFGYGIAVDFVGNAWITGSHKEDIIAPIVKYPVTDGSMHNGAEDVFVTKLNPVGALLFSTLIGGELGDFGNSIAVTWVKDVWITGKTDDTTATYPVTDWSTHNGKQDVFVTKLALPKSSDFNKDGKSDILRKYTPDGRTLVWTMFGNIVALAQWTSQLYDKNWEVVGIGDFDGDGKADILRRYKPYGLTAVWFMSGRVVLAAHLTTKFFNNNWEVAGVGDLNGDGKADILWRYKPDGRTIVWTMDDATVTSIKWTSLFFNVNWKVAGIGDFNDDEKVDVLWRYKPDGRTLLWTMSGNIATSIRWTTQFFNVNWAIVGLGDFNNDGKADVFWRYKPDGRTLIRFMSGNVVLATQWTSKFFNNNWAVARLGDYNGDGRSDVLWRYKPDGRTLIRLMSGRFVIATRWTSKQYNNNWSVE